MQPRRSSLAGRLSLPLALHGPPETRSCASGCELGFTFNSQASFLCLAQPGIPSILFNFHARSYPRSLAVAWGRSLNEIFGIAP